MTSFTKPEVHSSIALPLEMDRATATGKVFKKFGEIWTCGFYRVMSARYMLSMRLSVRHKSVF